MKTETRILFAVGTLAVAAVLMWLLNGVGGSAPAQTLAAIVPAVHDANAARSELTDDKTTNERTAAAPAPVADAWLDHPYTVELAVRIVDPNGLPVAGHKLRLAPFGCALNRADQETGPDGTVLLSWRTRQPTLEIELVDPRDQLRRLTLTQGHRTEITLLGESEQAGPTFRLMLTQDDNGNGAPATRDLPVRFTMSSGVTLSGNDGGLAMHPGLHPFAVFTDRMARKAAEADAGARIMLGRSMSIDSLIAGGISITDGVSGTFSTPAVTGSIAGTVFGEDGKPAPKVAVVLLGESPQPLQRGESDDSGAFHFDDVLAGNFTVRAGGDREGQATAPVVVTTGATPATLQLRRGACVRGHASGADGKPLADATVEWRSLDDSWMDATKTQSDGSFVLANLPGGPGRLLLFAPNADPKMPIAIAPSVLPDTGDVVLHGDPEGGSTLRIEPVEPNELTGAADVPLTIRVWQAETGLGIRIQKPESGDVWSLPHLPAGDYDVELRFPGGGNVACGRHWLDGKTVQDLGRVDLPHGGTLHLALTAADQPAAENKRAVEVSAMHPGIDVLISPSPAADRDLWLPTGDYVFAWRRADDSVHFERFTIAAGKCTVVPAAK